MYLKDTALCVNQREGTLNLIRGMQNRRYNSCIGKGGFYEAVKICGDDDFYESLCSQRRDGAMRRRRLFFSLFALLVVRFKIRTK